MVRVALAWEAAYHQATAEVERSVLLRAGVALDGDDDPATARLRQLVRLCAGGPVAGGDQWVSWLALDDLLRIILGSLDDVTARGLYLATSPHPVTNREMMAAYRRLLGFKVGLPAPALVTRIGAWAMGSDPALALTGRRGIPARLLDAGFEFRTTDFEEAAANALGRA
jgi:NAD dependent epimerase/dehydratase family enzyme